MTFLDTVDGKLARCTLTSSKIGGALDHGLDLVHPPIWWAAWAYGLAPGMQGYEVAMWIIVGGYVLGRLLEGVFMAFFKQEMFTWRPFDGFFRTIIARRNPNLVLLSVGTAMGRPDAGFIAVAVWTVICNVIQVVRIVQAFGEQRRGNPIRPWHEERAEAVARSIDPERARSLAGRTSLRQLLVLYDMADVLVSNDSGPVHFAALTEVPVVALYGPETPQIYGPLSYRARTLSAGLMCSPCVNILNHRMSPCLDNQCMQQLSVDQVLSATRELLTAPPE